MSFNNFHIFIRKSIRFFSCMGYLGLFSRNIMVVKRYSEHHRSRKSLNVAVYDCYVDQIRDFERQGLNLRPELRDEAERLKTRIRELCNVFQNNLNEDETELQFTAEELAGTHPNFIKVIV